MSAAVTALASAALAQDAPAQPVAFAAPRNLFVPAVAAAVAGAVRPPIAAVALPVLPRIALVVSSGRSSRIR